MFKMDVRLWMCDVCQAKKCAAAVGFDFDAITACNNGEKGNTLQLKAAEYFELRFPTHAHSGLFQVGQLQHDFFMPWTRQIVLSSEVLCGVAHHRCRMFLSTARKLRTRPTTQPS